MTETNHPIAEQDSLERLIARLREKEQLVDFKGSWIGWGASINPDGPEAADTLCQMRDALKLTRSRLVCLHGTTIGHFNNAKTVERWCADIDAALTTTKIEKDHTR